MLNDDTQNHIQKNFFELPIDLCCVINTENQAITHANQAFETILGWSPNEIIGQKLTKLAYEASDATMVEKTFAKIALGLHTLTFEMQCQTKNKQQRTISWKCYITVDSHQLFGIGRDVTQYKEVEKLLIRQANMDSVTGVYGRQTFYTMLQNELNNAARYSFDSSVVLINIDSFKEYNYTYGVEKGDECLKQIAFALKSSLRRKTDFLARFSNDEFIVLLSHNDLTKALKVADYLKSNLGKLTIQHDPREISQSITVSIGVTATTSENRNISAEKLLNSAIRALNVSRQRGGNQINYV